MSVHPYLHSSDTTTQHTPDLSQTSTSRSSVRSTLSKDSRSSINTGCPSPGSRRSSCSSVTRMQTTVAVADEVPHRFRIVPLRETRGAVPLLSESTARDLPASSQNGVLREWAAKLRHVRTKSAGSSLLSAKKALSASLDAVRPYHFCVYPTCNF
ncbi:hypothetical protein BKA93DRAFT_307832 [Sparassis latifolia]